MIYLKRCPELVGTLSDDEIVVAAQRVALDVSAFAHIYYLRDCSTISATFHDRFE